MLMRTILLFLLLLGCGDRKPADKRPPEPAPITTDAPLAPPPPIDAVVAVDAAVDASPAVDPAAASKAAFPELLDLKKRFVFEIVKGRSATKLKPIKGAPAIYGTTSVPEALDEYTRIYLTTRADEGMKAKYAEIGMLTIGIVIDADGIRQLAALGGRVGNKGNIRGFTFPHTLDTPTKTIEGQADFGPVTVTVSRQKLVLANTEHEVLFSETKLVEESYNATSYETNAYAPGLGPALLCLASGDRKDLTCLRYVATEDRSCTKLANTLCEGKTAQVCDDVFMKLLVDPKDGKPRMSQVSEKLCAAALKNPAEADLLRQSIVP